MECTVGVDVRHTRVNDADLDAAASIFELCVDIQGAGGIPCTNRGTSCGPFNYVTYLSVREM